MKRAFLPLLAVAVIAAACKSQGTSGEAKPGTGSVKVTVTAVPKEGIHGPSSYESSGNGPVRINYGGLDGIVVYVDGKSESVPPTRPLVPASFKLTASGFEPILLACPPRISIENTTSSPATIYAVAAFDAGTLAPGATKIVRPSAFGPSEVLVDERDDARATIFVADTERVTTLKSGGSITWQGLAPGSYVAHAWHKRFPEAQASVTVTADSTAEVELKLGVNDLPKVR